MVSANLKAVVTLLTTINLVYPPTIPKVEISFAQLSSLVPFSSIFSDSLSPTSSMTACLPDLSMLLTEVTSCLKEKTYESCIGDVHGSRNQTHPDLGKFTHEIISQHGYPVEMYNVTTKDGYILSVHRIARPGNTPVYLQHGLGGSSDSWMYIHRDHSLAFLLADHGYDVWIGNFRGSTYSLGHVNLDWDHPSDYSYWDFSWHENAIYDVPAIVDLILGVTGKAKLLYIGYSMGAQSYFIALDLVPELNDKIEAGIVLAPGGFLGRSPHPLRILSPLGTIKGTKYLEKNFRGRIDEASKLHQILGNSPGLICTPTAIRCQACDHLIFALFGVNAAQMNYTNVPNVISRYPNIMSVKTMYHYAQGMNTCGFRQFDYGPEKNMEVYKSRTPPDYTLKNVRVKTYAFYGLGDNVFTPEDVKRTLDLLPNGTLVESIQVGSTFFNHVDFVIAKDINPMLYRKILSILKNVSHPLSPK